MTDIGNTGSQVAPNVNEQEINMVREIFEKMANSLVGLSSAAKDIAEMREQLEGLKQDIERTQGRNRELDEMVAHVRRERDEAREQVHMMKAEVDREQSAHQDAALEIARLRADLEQVNAQLVEARRDRDDASFKNMELQEIIDKGSVGTKELEDDRNYWRSRAESLNTQLSEAQDKLHNVKKAAGCFDPVAMAS